MIRDELIRDRIMIGICDTRASERMQLMNDLTLEKAFEIARQAEVQVKEGKKISQEDSEATKEEVNRVFQRRDNPSKPKQGGSKDIRQEEQTCGRCGYPSHTQGKKCPALKSTCRRCKKEGHWDRMYRSKEIRRIEQEDDNEEEACVTYAFIGAVNHSAHKTEFKFKAHVTEFSKQLHFIVDTGADITCISDESVPKSCRNKICRTEKIISGPDGKKIIRNRLLTHNTSREKIRNLSKSLRNS